MACNNAHTAELSQEPLQLSARMQADQWRSGCGICPVLNARQEFSPTLADQAPSENTLDQSAPQHHNGISVVNTSNQNSAGSEDTMNLLNCLRDIGRVMQHSKRIYDVE